MHKGHTIDLYFGVLCVCCSATSAVVQVETDRLQMFSVVQI